MRFRNRVDAGRRLAEEIGPRWGEDAIVLALPRGGVPVAAEIARALGCQVDVLGVHKVGAPGNPEFAVGAVAEDGGVSIDERVAQRSGWGRESLAEAVCSELEGVRRRVALYRAGAPPPRLEGRRAIVVDDGLATGHTMLAAIGLARRRGAAAVVVAVPVGDPDSLARAGAAADELHCLLSPARMWGVSRWYRDFSPVGDEEVVRILSARPGTPRA